jgi:hypothetical protein
MCDVEVHRVYIFELAYLVAPGRDWSRDLDIGGSPTRELLDERVARNAATLRRCGREIITGRAWFDSDAKVLRAEQG